MILAEENLAGLRNGLRDLWDKAQGSLQEAAKATMPENAMYATVMRGRALASHQEIKAVLRGALLALGACGVCAQPVARRLLLACLPEGVPAALLPDVLRHNPAATSRFAVDEYSSGFEVRDTVTGQTHWLSDGVDVIEAGEDLGMLSPGTPGFAAMWADMLNADERVTLEAYFPEQYARENEE